MQNEIEQTPQASNQPGETIIAGANNEDQLDGFRSAAASTDSASATEYGTQPSTGDEHTDFENASQDIDADNLNDATPQNQDPSGADLGGITNLSLDQLKAEGDNNN